MALPAPAPTKRKTGIDTSGDRSPDLYGKKTKSILAENVFGDISTEGLESDQPTVQKPAPSVQKPARPEPEMKSVVKETEPELEEPTEPETNPESEPEVQAEHVDIEESEYDYLSTLEPEQLIAFGAKHRKSASTMQSKFDRVKKAIGTKLADAIEKGELPKEAVVLFNNLDDEAFQQHISGFFDTHTPDTVTGKYQRVSGYVPDADTLQQYQKLVLEKAKLNVRNFMPEDSDFDYNEALTEPSSASGIAYSKYEAERARIDGDLSRIQAMTKPSQPAVSAEDRARAGEQAIAAMVAKHPELGDQETLTSYQAFIREAHSDLAEVFYQAWKSQNGAAKKMKRLILNEVQTITNNQSAPKQPNKIKGKADSRYLESDQALMEKDAEYFGDSV